MKRIVIVTGATSGIGEATAIKCAKAGFDIIITGRRKERLEAVICGLVKIGFKGGMDFQFFVVLK